MTRRWLFGLILLLGVVLIWVLSSTFMQYIFLQQNFAHPFFLTYISTSLFTIYLFGFACCKSWRSGNKTSEWVVVEKEPPPQQQTERQLFESSAITTDSEPLTTTSVPSDTSSSNSRSFLPVTTTIPLLEVRRIVLISAMFCPLWFAANYTFNASLLLTSVSSNTIISATSSFWTLLFGAIFCVEEFAWGKLVGSFLCVAGVALVSITDENRAGANSLKGDLLSLLAAVFYGLYITFLRKQIKNERQVPMAMFFGFVGLLNCLCLWPLLILLHFVGVEVWEWPSAQVLLFLCINGLIGTVLSDLLWSYSVFYTSPLIASVGLSLTIPLAIGVERFLHHRDFTWSYLLGSGLVVSGFVLVNIASRQCEKDCWSRTKQCHCFKSNPTVDAPPDTILEDGQRTALVS